jgi:hypothetical protein
MYGQCNAIDEMENAFVPWWDISLVYGPTTLIDLDMYGVAGPMATSFYVSLAAGKLAMK